MKTKRSDQWFGRSVSYVLKDFLFNGSWNKLFIIFASFTGSSKRSKRRIRRRRTFGGERNAPAHSLKVGLHGPCCVTHARWTPACVEVTHWSQTYQGDRQLVSRPPDRSLLSPTWTLVAFSSTAPCCSSSWRRGNLHHISLQTARTHAA